MKEFKDIKNNKYSKLLWIEINDKYFEVERREIEFSRNNVKYHIKITLFQSEKHIEVESDTLVELEKLYFLIGKVRRYEYLFDGAFYILQTCIADNEDITDIISKVELGYFQNAGYKHKIPLKLDDREYKKYFCKWLTFEKKIRYYKSNDFVCKQCKRIASRDKNINIDRML